ARASAPCPLVERLRVLSATLRRVRLDQPAVAALPLPADIGHGGDPPSHRAPPPRPPPPAAPPRPPPPPPPRPAPPFSSPCARVGGDHRRIPGISRPEQAGFFVLTLSAERTAGRPWSTAR